MTKMLKKSYQREFETTNINIDDLLQKYSLDLEDLEPIDNWTKTYEEPQPLDAELIEIISADSELHNNIVLPPTAEANNIPTTPEVKSKETILLDINKFKQKAVKEAIRFMDKDVDMAEIKEFKDMVAIVDSIEKSYTADKTNDSTTINILIQNLQQKFKDTPDDC